MLVIDLEAPPPRLRGLLSRWCVEVRAGLYVGSYGKDVREAIWREVERLSDRDTSAVLIHSTPGGQGFEFRTLGRNRREPIQQDGLWLVRFRPPTISTPAGSSPTDGSSGHVLPPEPRDG